MLGAAGWPMVAPENVREMLREWREMATPWVWCAKGSPGDWQKVVMAWADGSNRVNFENWMANSRGALPPAKSPDLFAAWVRNGMPTEYDQHPLWARQVGVGWGKGSPGSSGASDLAASVSGESHTSSGDLDVTGGGGAGVERRSGCWLPGEPWWTSHGR